MNYRYFRFFTLILIFCIPLASSLSAQRLMGLSRYDDNFVALSKDSARKFTLLPGIKALYLDEKKQYYVGFGGEVREQAQLFNNESWGSLRPGVTKGNSGDVFLLQRYMFHTNIQLSKYFRIFGEFKSMFESGCTTGARPGIDEDHLDLHQLLADFNLFLSEGSKLTLRVGRQELNYGASRLISLNEGPNTRQAFQGVKLMYSFAGGKVDGFYMNPVTNNKGIFDDVANTDKKLYGVYSSWVLSQAAQTNLDAYVLGFQNLDASYLKGLTTLLGEEKRYTVGARFYRSPTKAFVYDMEAMYQFGTFSNLDISSFMAVAEVDYTFLQAKTKPDIGFVAQIVSGDQGNSGKLNTFNPLYTRVYYGLGMPYWPANLLQLAPKFQFKPTEKLTAAAGIHALWRESTSDGLYLEEQITRLPYNPATRTPSSSSFIGMQYDISLDYEVTNYLGLEGQFSTMRPEKYVQETGTANTIVWFGLQAKFRF